MTIEQMLIEARDRFAPEAANIFKHMGWTWYEAEKEMTPKEDDIKKTCDRLAQDLLDHIKNKEIITDYYPITTGRVYLIYHKNVNEVEFLLDVS